MGRGIMAGRGADDGAELALGLELELGLGDGLTDCGQG